MGRYPRVNDAGRYTGDGNIEGSNPAMRIITINVPEKYCLFIEKLIEWGEVLSRSEYIRHATKKAIETDLKFTEKVDAVIESDNPHLVRIPIGNGVFQTHRVIRRLE